MDEITAALTADPRTPRRALVAVRMTSVMSARVTWALRAHPNTPFSEPRRLDRPLGTVPSLPRPIGPVTATSDATELDRAAIRVAHEARRAVQDGTPLGWALAGVIAVHPSTSEETRRVAIDHVVARRDELLAMNDPPLLSADRLTLVAALSLCLARGEHGSDAVTRCTLPEVGYITSGNDRVGQYVRMYLSEAVTKRAPKEPRDLQYYLAALAMEDTFDDAVADLLRAATPVTRRAPT